MNLPQTNTHRIGRYDLSGKHIFGIDKKYYFENMRIRNIITGYRRTDTVKPLSGTEVFVRISKSPLSIIR